MSNILIDSNTVRNNKNNNCKMCHLLSRGNSSYGLNKLEASNNHAPLNAYTSLLAFNKHRRPVEQQQNHHFSPNSSSSSSAIYLNGLVTKIVSIIFLHVTVIYLIILAFEYINIIVAHVSRHSVDLFQIISIAYLIFYLVLLTCHSLRTTWPYNLAVFIVYTLLASLLYAATLLAYPALDLLRHTTLLVSLTQLLILSLFALQIKFTIVSAPRQLTYLLVFALQLGLVASFLIVLDYSTKRPHYFYPSNFLTHFLVVSTNNSTSINKSATTMITMKIDWPKIALTFVCSSLVVFYEIYDLQRWLLELSAEFFSSQSSQEPLTIAFNLLSVDYLKISLELLRKIIK